MNEKRTLEIAIALVWRNGQVLVSRRPAGAHLAGYWEFPGGKLRAGEDPLACAEREVAEEVAVAARARSERKLIVHEYEDRVVRLHVVDCDWQSGEPETRQVAEVRFCQLSELAALEFPPANAELLAELGVKRA